MYFEKYEKRWDKYKERLTEEEIYKSTLVEMTINRYSNEGKEITRDLIKTVLNKTGSFKRLFPIVDYLELKYKTRR